MKQVALAAVLALTLAPAIAAEHGQGAARLTRADLLELADSGHALALAEACGLWGDARWFAEARRRIRLLVAHGTPSRTDRALFEGAFAMGERRAREMQGMLGPIACRGVAISDARRSYDDLLGDARLGSLQEPPATRE
jgi:predicted secreted protein